MGNNDKKCDTPTSLKHFELIFLNYLFVTKVVNALIHSQWIRRAIRTRRVYFPRKGTKRLSNPFPREDFLRGKFCTVIPISPLEPKSCKFQIQKLTVSISFRFLVTKWRNFHVMIMRNFDLHRERGPCIIFIPTKKHIVRRVKTFEYKYIWRDWRDRNMYLYPTT